MRNDPDRRQAAHARDAATRRIRVVTVAAAAVTVGATGVFAAFAAASTHTKRVVSRTHTVARQVTRSAVVRAAPAPPLVAVAAESAAPPSEAAPAAPVSPPVSVAPAVSPVVVSGGS